MSANSKCAKIIFLTIAIFSLNSCLRNASKTIYFPDIKGMWKIETLIVDNEDVSDKFLTLSFSFVNLNEVFVPRYKSVKLSDKMFCEWKMLTRKEDYIYIEDCHQGVLTGEYKMQLSKVESEKTLLLIKEDITIELKAVDGNLGTGMPTNFGRR